MVDEARAQKVVDQMIKAKEAQFIRQIHLLRPLLKKITIDGKLDAKLPLQLLPFITQPELKEQIVNGKGLQCRAFAPRNVSFEITLKAAGAAKVGDEGGEKCNVMIESEEWKEMIVNSKIKENAVVSLWVFYTGDDQATSASTSSLKFKPGFIFRVDGYVKQDEPLPPIPSLTK